MNDMEPWVFLPERESFFGAAPETAWDVIRWWERRRIGYNGLIGALFGVGWVVITILAVVLMGPGGLVSDIQTALIVALGCLSLILIMNLCFTIGWVSELLIRLVVRRKVDGYGPIAYKVITGISIPAVPILIIWHLLGIMSAMFN